MTMKRKNAVFFGLVSAVGSVHAENYLKPAFKTLSDLGVAETMRQYPLVWDILLFSIFFYLLGKKILGNRFGNNVGGMIGLIMSASLIAFEVKLNFRVIGGVYGSYIAIATIMTMFVFIIRLIMGEQEGKKFSGSAFGIFIMLTMIMLTKRPDIMGYIARDNSFLRGLISIVWVFSGIFGISWLFRQIMDKPGYPLLELNPLNRTANFIEKGRENLDRIKNALRRKKGEAPSKKDIEKITIEINRLKNILFSVLFSQVSELNNNVKTPLEGYIRVCESGVVIKPAEKRDGLSRIANFFASYPHFKTEWIKFITDLEKLLVSKEYIINHDVFPKDKKALLDNIIKTTNERRKIVEDSLYIISFFRGICL